MPCRWTGSVPGANAMGIANVGGDYPMDCEPPGPQRPRLSPGIGTALI
jgi:hypothetical protein